MHVQSSYGNRNITRFCEIDKGNIMVSEWMKNFLFGLGFGILIETLIFLSPLFETTLWETFCTFVKVIPFNTLFDSYHWCYPHGNQCVSQEEKETMMHALRARKQKGWQPRVAVTF